MWPSNRKLWMLRGIILISTLHASTSTCPKNWKDILSLRHCHKFRNDWGVSSHHVNILTRPKYSLVKWVWIQALLLPFESPHHTHTHTKAPVWGTRPQGCVGGTCAQVMASVFGAATETARLWIEAGRSRPLEIMTPNPHHTLGIQVSAGVTCPHYMLLLWKTKLPQPWRTETLEIMNTS